MTVSRLTGKGKIIMKLKLGISFVAASAIALMSSVAQSAPDDNSLVIAWGSTGPIEHVDNYVNTNRTGIWFSRMVWDQLIYREPKHSNISHC